MCPSSGLAVLGAKGQKERRPCPALKVNGAAAPSLPSHLDSKEETRFAWGRVKRQRKWAGALKGVGRGDKKRVHSGDMSKRLLMNFGESGVDRKPQGLTRAC